MINIHFPCADLSKRMNLLAKLCLQQTSAQGRPDPQTYLALEAQTRWRPTPLAQAQLVVYPYWPMASDPRVNQTALLAKSAGLPCLFFSETDDGAPVDPPHGLVYRTSLFGRLQTARERAAPAFTLDPLEPFGGEVRVRPKADTPTVAFCGNVGSPANLLHHDQYGSWMWPGTHIRRKALRRLGREPSIRCSFIRKKEMFWRTHLRLGRAAQAGGQQFNQSRQQYVQNLLDADYVLCARGVGNFSIRFYETLAAGRIPLFIDTDCVLPFCDRINWREICVWVPASRLGQIGQILARFHQAIPPDHFQAMQVHNREVWKKWLTPLSFYQRAIDETMGVSSEQQDIRYVRPRTVQEALGRAAVTAWA